MAWSERHREWCCEHEARGCTTTTTFELYNCEAGYHNWLEGWSHSKKEWCCKTQDRGCAPYHCTGTLQEKDSWSMSKALWCCKHWGKRCPDGEEQAGIPEFDCSAGYNAWYRGWSRQKKNYCCEHASRGCTTNETHYSCEYVHKEEILQWSPQKRNFCCTLEHVGCGPTRTVTTSTTLFGWTTTNTFTTTSTTSTRACNAHWQKTCMLGTPPSDTSTRMWCCEKCNRHCHTTRTLTTTTHLTTALYDCFTGYENWQLYWSPGKQSWCCKEVMRGCPDPRVSTSTWTFTVTFTTRTTTYAPFDCDVHSSHIAWPEPKKVYCCRHRGVGCPTTSLPYDCSRSSSDNSPQRNVWCCRYNGVGCVTTTTKSFDCRAGLANAEAGWSVAKKAYCCEEFGMGPHCSRHTKPLATTSLLYDCNAALARADTAWSYSKQAWCCKNEHKGCVSTTDGGGGTQFNCKLGQPKYWPKGKQRWCCAREGRGCDDDFRIVGRDDASVEAPSGDDRSTWRGRWLPAGRSLLSPLALGALGTGVLALALRAVRGWRLWRPVQTGGNAAGTSARGVIGGRSLWPRGAAPRIPNPRELCTMESEYMPVEN